MADGMFSEQFGCISKQRSFQSCGLLSKIGTDKVEFDDWWEQMQSNTSYPNTIIGYHTQDWVTCKDMWSVIFCQNHTIFEGDTNMLLKS